MQETPLSPATAFAQWLDRSTVVWNTPDSGRCALEYTPDPAAAREVLPLGPVRGGLPRRLRLRYPHLATFRAFEVPADDLGRLGDALRSPLVATRRDDSGRLLDTTGVQLPGVLDDLFAAATAERLGPTWHEGTPRLAVWAPTARSVTLKLYASSSGTDVRLVRMRRDDRTGVWSVTGRPDWRGCYYTYLVTVYAPSIRAVVTNEVTDPYSLSLSADSVRSQLVDLADPALMPPGWATLGKPPVVRPDQASIYELHVRDFSACDATVPPPLRGTYSAFTVPDSAGMRALRELAADGLTHVQLMPVSDFAATRERRTGSPVPPVELTTLPPDSERQQEWISATQGRDEYDWGYDPLHYTAPEGSYATDPDGHARIKQLRAAVAALNEAGLRVVMDVVYNHTHASGQEPGSVLDRVVPGYYQRLREDGAVCTATGCLDTAPEHQMMAKLVTDSVLTWAEQYKIDGFRFDLMGFHPKADMLALRAELDKLSSVDGAAVLLYGEGWEFGEVAGDARFVQATQHNMAGTGIGTFNDRLRDAVRGGGPLDADPRAQGFGSGLFTAPNGAAVNGSRAEQRARLLRYQELISIGLTGNLVSDTAADAGYNAEPGEAITYVDCHDNQTLFDALAHRLPQDTTLADRVRMQVLSLAVVLLGQGAAFVLAGSDRLRSKSLDRNSYNSGGWFNRLLWNCEDGNGFGAGLPPAADNRAYWDYARPLLSDPALRPDRTAITAAHERFREFLRIRRSSPAFAIGTAAEIRRRITFPARDIPGVITMRIDTTELDPRWRAVIVVFNATPASSSPAIDAPPGARITLHPVIAGSVDPVMHQSAFDSVTRRVTVPARTAAVFVQL
ncbi:pullulanase-type alpha-1,6-glucosidase [Amycolatopsis mongoliensis]|uniref:Pullulanase-type alpha-1,6-glucosidase n=1 Tax=Amycolatopsis mongoliensis TaxID=715475 RepID=A0A9Y2NA77_9PSEU|nr:pullulanase-type alpha-1,6-glucosidase [Amycolatopsis sp. 4-36]WIX98320.1 pullulanase-type alpha-1,6-glucosidase [Amycolatopsis sp. 4-36]